MPTVHLPDPADFFAVVDDASASRARRVDHDLENDGEEGTRVVGRGQCVADERKRLAGVTLGTTGLRPATPVAPGAKSSSFSGRAQQAEQEPQGDGRRERGQDDQRQISAQGD
jgi:hypothetical protein